MTLRTRYKKVVGDYRDVKYFYSNDSPNNDSRRCSKTITLFSTLKTSRVAHDNSQLFPMTHVSVLPPLPWQIELMFLQKKMLMIALINSFAH